jgi:hypothetical protein
MAVERWTFTDPVTLDSYEFEINPSDGGSPTYKKNIAFQNTAAPDGRVLAFEGRPSPQTGNFKGTILTEEHYNAMLEWFGVKNQIYMTDDLGRTQSIYITDFDPQRVRAVQHPWKHSFTVSYFVLDWD